MTREGEITQLLGTLYAAPIQPEMWNAFLTQLSAMTGITKAAIISHDIAANDHRMLATVGDKTRESVGIYESCYYQFDGWTSRFPRVALTGKIVRGEDFWPKASLIKSVFYNEFLKKFDTCEMACLSAVGTPLVFEALSVYRGPSDDEFSLRNLALLESIAPHLKTALSMRRKLLALESRVSDLEAAFDQISSAFVLIDAAGKIALVNESSRQILDRRDGIWLQNGKLSAQSMTENARLREIQTKAILAASGKSTANAGAMLVSRGSGSPLQLIASPLRSFKGPMPGNAVVIIFITDPDQRTAAPAEVLRILFTLTPAEGRLALSLLNGNSLAEAAELNEVGRETVRSQLKSIFHKTGTQRQGELIRLLASTSVPRTSGDGT